MNFVVPSDSEVKPISLEDDDELGMYRNLSDQLELVEVLEAVVSVPFGGFPTNGPVEESDVRSTWVILLDM